MRTLFRAAANMAKGRRLVSNTPISMNRACRYIHDADTVNVKVGCAGKCVFNEQMRPATAIDIAQTEFLQMASSPVETRYQMYAGKKDDINYVDMKETGITNWMQPSTLTVSFKTVPDY